MRTIFMALDWNLKTLLVRRMQHTVTAISDSETSLKVFEGQHTWTIRNWKDWINCSEDSKKSTIYSDVFTIPVCEGEAATRWQILAFAKRNVKTNKDYLAFRSGFIFFATFAWFLGAIWKFAFYPPINKICHRRSIHKYSGFPAQILTVPEFR